MDNEADKIKLHLEQGGDHGYDTQVFAQAVYDDPNITIDRITPGFFVGMLHNEIDEHKLPHAAMFGEILNVQDSETLRNFGEELIRKILSRISLSKVGRGEEYPEEDMHADHEKLERMLEDTIDQRNS